MSPCSFPKSGRKLLLTGLGAEAQTGLNDFGVRNGDSPGYFFLVTGELSAHLHVTPGSPLYVHYKGARKKLFREAFATEEVEIPPTTVFVAHGYVQDADSEWR